MTFLRLCNTPGCITNLKGADSTICSACARTANLAKGNVGRAPQARRVPTPDLSAGACFASESPDAWYSDDHHDRAWAIRFCNRCPVADICLEYSIEAKEPDGIWGGKGISERTRIIRNRRRKAEAASA